MSPGVPLSARSGER